jgi:NADH dehydrogenase FAD-containing subunit
MNVDRAEDRGIAVNGYLQSTSNSAVYAAGDAVTHGDFRLTPVAALQGAVVVTNLRHGNTRTAGSNSPTDDSTGGTAGWRGRPGTRPHRPRLVVERLDYPLDAARPANE